jgi:hypothetical protein
MTVGRSPGAQRPYEPADLGDLTGQRRCFDRQRADTAGHRALAIELFYRMGRLCHAPLVKHAEYPCAVRKTAHRATEVMTRRCRRGHSSQPHALRSFSNCPTRQRGARWTERGSAACRAGESC